MSAKWTAVSFFTLTALGAASFAFAGCTVTSGTPDNFEGGTGNPPVDGGGDTAVANACPGNTKQTGIFVSPACQSALESACCAELTTCFDLDPSGTDAGPTALDCNKFSDCTAQCNAGPDADLNECQSGCNLATGDPVKNAYDALVTCVTNKANTVCQP